MRCKVEIEMDFTTERDFVEGEIVEIDGIYKKPLKRCCSGGRKYQEFYVEKGTGCLVVPVVCKIIK